mmetsp:Transcript_12018/g.28189  ORF Transcript_12018/g.28189 Transcript_12018/m.28189 type:complete len:172 (+) Transcript_12018:48-563(+)
MVHGVPRVVTPAPLPSPQLIVAPCEQLQSPSTCQLIVVREAQWSTRSFFGLPLRVLQMSRSTKGRARPVTCWAGLWYSRRRRWTARLPRSFGTWAHWVAALGYSIELQLVCSELGGARAHGGAHGPCKTMPTRGVPARDWSRAKVGRLVEEKRRPRVQEGWTDFLRARRAP